MVLTVGCGTRRPLWWWREKRRVVACSAAGVTCRAERARPRRRPAGDPPRRRSLIVAGPDPLGVDAVHIPPRPVPDTVKRGGPPPNGPSGRLTQSTTHSLPVIPQGQARDGPAGNAGLRYLIQAAACQSRPRRRGNTEHSRVRARGSSGVPSGALSDPEDPPQKPHADQSLGGGRPSRRRGSQPQAQPKRKQPRANPHHDGSDSAGWRRHQPNSRVSGARPYAERPHVGHRNRTHWREPYADAPAHDHEKMEAARDFTVSAVKTECSARPRADAV